MRPLLLLEIKWILLVKEKQVLYNKKDLKNVRWTLSSL